MFLEGKMSGEEQSEDQVELCPFCGETATTLYDPNGSRSNYGIYWCMNRECRMDQWTAKPKEEK